MSTRAEQATRRAGVCVLSGGVGGAKLVEGFYHALSPGAPSPGAPSPGALSPDVLSPGALTVITNGGDDLLRFGLRICPDSDTVAYTLSGRVGPFGWGLEGESFRALGHLRRFASSWGWFQLGDGDLGLHLFRAHCLAQGMGMAAVQAKIATALNLRCRLLPMSESLTPTWVETETHGWMHLQRYLLFHRAALRLRGLRYVGLLRARPAPGVLAALGEARLVVLAPSNPLISIGPILATPGVRRALADSKAWRVGVSPLVGGRAIKGPTLSMLRELRFAGEGSLCDERPIDALSVARLYRDVLDVWVIDPQDAHLQGAIEALGLRCMVHPIVMRGRAEKCRLAEAIVAFCDARAR